MPRSICHALIKRGVNEVHYMAGISVMASIAERGILSFNALKRAGMASRSLANRDVQARRGNTRIVNIELHEFVPLYFATHTPMQYEIEHRNGFDSDDLFIVDVSVKRIGELARLLYFTDCNAACSYVEFRDKPEHLATIDWHIVQNVKRCLSPDYKARKAAELLVYPKVETQCIARIVTRSEGARRQILRFLKKPHAPVEIDRSRYFK
jgi:hypothetical protein